MLNPLRKSRNGLYNNAIVYKWIRIAQGDHSSSRIIEVVGAAGSSSSNEEDILSAISSINDVVGASSCSSDCVAMFVPDEVAAYAVETIVCSAMVVVATRAGALPFSNWDSTSFEPVGMNLVQKNAILSPRSTMRCLRMNATTRKKNAREARINTLSSQSDFSRAVTSVLDVERRLVSVSCWVEVLRSVFVESSTKIESEKDEASNTLGHARNIWVDKTERSSSACIRAVVRLRASVIWLFVFMRTSSLAKS